MLNHRRTYLILGTVVVSFIAGSPSAAGDGAVADLIRTAKRTSATPELIQEMDRVIAANQGHPDILSLRLWRLRAQKGLSSGDDDIRSLIEQYGEFAKESMTDPEINYAAYSDAGYLLQHYQRNYSDAYRHYKRMEAHPLLGGKDVQADYRKVELYTRIAQCALGCGQLEDVEKYARLVLAYPSLGMEDRQMYKKFYDLYDEAGRAFLEAFREDVKRLVNVEIYPSHEELYEMRLRYVRENLSRIPGVSWDEVSSPEEVAAAIENSLQAARVPTMPSGSEFEPPVSLPTSKEPLPVSLGTGQSGGGVGGLTRRRAAIWIAAGAAAVLVGVAGAAAYLKRRRVKGRAA